MGASRLKPLTVKEVEKLTATRPSTIKHRYLGRVLGLVLVHTPAGHTSYGLIYRANGERKKLTLGNTKIQRREDLGIDAQGFQDAVRGLRLFVPHFFGSARQDLLDALAVIAQCEEFGTQR